MLGNYYGSRLNVVQDNTPIHAAHIIRNFFVETYFEIMKSPPYSRDLNLIENLWKSFKAMIIEIAPEVQTFNGNQRNRRLLNNTEIIAWDSMDEALLDKLAADMQNRVDAEIKAWGL